MYIPAEFTNAIGTLYDKELNLYSHTSQPDETGWVRRELTSTGESFMGNVRFANLDKIKQAYGITKEIDIAITTAENVPVNSVVEYNSVFYIIIKAIPSDSHYMLIGQIWQYTQGLSV